jgi:hypothetical protein
MPTVLSAGRVLRESGIDPADVRRELPTVEPYAVRIRVAPRLLRLVWARGIVAMALPWGVFVTPATFAKMAEGAAADSMGPLVVHELAHLDQFARLGVIRHVVLYLGDYLRARLTGSRHWDAYRAVRLEVDARRIAGRLRKTRGPV